MNLTKNGEDFFCNCSVIDIDDDTIQGFGVTDKDLEILLENDYLYWNEYKQCFSWRE